MVRYLMMLSCVVAIACTASEDEDNDNGGSTSLTLSSSETADGFNDGGEIPLEFACTDLGGNNGLPTLSWSGTPEETESFALIVIDTSTDPETIHMVLFDISSTISQVDDEDDFSQANFAQNYLDNQGYDGPCPPEGDEAHTYEFTLYALDVADLVGETGADVTDSDDVTSKIGEHDLDADSISGTFAAP